MKAATFALGVAALAVAAPATAADDRAELWLNPSVTADVDDKTFIELETAQRFRGQPADDTYYARVWLGREIADGVTLSGGIERRHEGEGRETRLLQQVSYPLGPLKGRTRLEQRFLNDEPRTGWRLRQRIGAAIPLSERENGWEFAANIEGFFVLRTSEPGAQNGLTGIRSFIGVEREWDNVELSIGYLRQQTVRNNARDTVGHAPFIGLGFKL
ncbi:MAG TPA: DUF2490 domain-containing protein [Sphingorhabdus sp.]|jgi:hypothetical protein|nr:DUF2490 domain-containing protein [Sphingorhabdus sp.]